MYYGSKWHCMSIHGPTSIFSREGFVVGFHFLIRRSPSIVFVRPNARTSLLILFLSKGFIYWSRELTWLFAVATQAMRFGIFLCWSLVPPQFFSGGAWCPLNSSKNSSSVATKPRIFSLSFQFLNSYVFSLDSPPFWLSRVISNFVSAWCVWLA